MKIFILELNEFRNLEVVGEYGTFRNPIVDYNGKEVIAELYDLENDTVMCQSASCSRCFSKGNSGCRLYASDNIAYAI